MPQLQVLLIVQRAFVLVSTFKYILLQQLIHYSTVHKSITIVYGGKQVDAGDHALLGLLDLSAAFDTVDHDVLVERLARTYGLRSTALDWLRSYLLDRRQSVFYDG